MEHRAKNAYAAQLLGELSQESRCKTSTRSRAHRHFLKLLMSPQHRKPWHHINHLLGVTPSQHGADLSAGENRDGLGQPSASAVLTLPLPPFCFDPLKSSTTHEVGNVDCQTGQSWTHRSSRTDSDLSWRGQAPLLWAKGFRGLGTEGWPVVRQSITAQVIATGSGKIDQQWRWPSFWPRPLLSCQGSSPTDTAAHLREGLLPEVLSRRVLSLSCALAMQSGLQTSHCCLCPASGIHPMVEVSSSHTSASMHILSPWKHDLSLFHQCRRHHRIASSQWTVNTSDMSFLELHVWDGEVSLCSEMSLSATGQANRGRQRDLNPQRMDLSKITSLFIFCGSKWLLTLTYTQAEICMVMITITDY